jgi:hypothetical protein
MPEMMYLHEYREGDRTAQVLKNMTTKKFIVYCFCCGNEAQSDLFDTEQDAESWAEDWVQKQVELTTLANDDTNKPCCC